MTQKAQHAFFRRGHLALEDTGEQFAEVIAQMQERKGPAQATHQDGMISMVGCGSSSLYPPKNRGLCCVTLEHFEGNGCLCKEQCSAQNLLIIRCFILGEMISFVAPYSHYIHPCLSTPFIFSPFQISCFPFKYLCPLPPKNVST